LENTAKESLSNHDPTEREILQQGYGILQMGRRDGFIAFAKPKQKPSCLYLQFLEKTLSIFCDFTVKLTTESKKLLE